MAATKTATNIDRQKYRSTDFHTQYTGRLAAIAAKHVKEMIKTSNMAYLDIMNP